MFFTSEHKMTSEEQFFIKSQYLGVNLPAELQLHLTLVYVEEQTFQCVWEASSIDIIEDYINVQFAGHCRSHYYEVDPFFAIGA